MVNLVSLIGVQQTIVDGELTSSERFEALSTCIRTCVLYTDSVRS